MTQWRIPFTRVHFTGRELEYMQQVMGAGQLAGDGTFARRCEKWLSQTIGCARVLLTPSGTAALEMAAILANVGPGDEVIMPSFTFASTANAFVLRGAVPVFVDVEPRTLNIDAARVASAVTSRTRAIVPIHYGGVSADLETLGRIARDAGAMLIEDAAQALLSTHRGRPIGSFGALAALSFHQTKNVSAGEAGALLINDPALIQRAEVVREKGTNRSRFYRGEVDKYTWVDVGSSYLPSELVAAFLFAQLEAAAEITARRMVVWQRYHARLEELEMAGQLVRPAPIADAGGNAHLYYVLLRCLSERTAVIDALREKRISAVFHYVPLHSSPAGRRYGRAAGSMAVTDDVSERLLRLPLWPDMTADDVDLVVDEVAAALRRTAVVGT
ncbi:MAG TPA: dTDP-4-amino-4,6-dideoxygalactose transaminase [Thermoanaerobaculia bacterium]